MRIEIKNKRLKWLLIGIALIAAGLLTGLVPGNLPPIVMLSAVLFVFGSVICVGAIGAFILTDAEISD